MVGGLDTKGLCLKLSALAGPFFFERSLKIAPLGINKNRFLLSWPRDSLGAGASAKFLRLLADMGFAEEAIEALDQHQRQARFIHFGFEGSDHEPKMKAYLEFDPDPTQHALRYLAVKSAPAPGAEEFVLSEYRQLAYQQPDQRRVDDLSIMTPAPLQALETTLIEIFWTDPARSDVLQVRDLGTRRLSFDWNVARSEVTPYQHTVLLDTARNFSEMYHASSVVEPALSDVHTLTHIAVGVSKAEHPFLTLYHDAEEWRDVYEFADHWIERSGLAQSAD